MSASVRILYIEDDPLDVKLVRETLRAGGLQFELDAVETRADFIQRLETGQFNLILADYRLPHFAGREALALARASRPQTPFIFVSGALGEEEAIELLKLGATDYVLKNRLSRLGPAVKRALDEAREQRQRHQADQELRESNLRLTRILESITGLLERLFENNHVLIAHLDADFNFLRVNQAYAQSNQNAPDFFTGRNFFEQHPQAGTRAVFQEVLKKGEPFFAKAQAEEPFGPQPHRAAFWDWSLQPVRNERGEVEGLLLCVLDVTRQMRARKERVASERRYRQLVENVDSIIMRWRPDGTIAFANRFARKFFGYAPEEFIGANVAGTLFSMTETAGPPLPPEPVSGAQAGPNIIWEGESVRRDGGHAWIRWTLRMIRDAARNTTEILCVGSDITDRKQKELEMQRVQQELRAFARTMGTTLHGRAISPGLAEGVALIYTPPESLLAGSQPISASEIDFEVGRLEQALATSVQELEEIQRTFVTQLADEELAIMEVHLTLLRDPSFAAKCKRRVRDDLVKVEHAVASEVRDLETRLQGLEHEFMRERSADVRDIGRRVLWNLRATGESPASSLKSLPPGTILVAEQLLPSDTLELDRKNVVAFVLERNGPASHVAILARGMGIPAVGDVRKATFLLETGDRLLVDAEEGTLIVAPTRTQTARFAARRARRATLAPVGAEDPLRGCVTQDGVGLRLYANIGRPDEVHLVLKNQLEGVGLFRSEFLFLDVDQPPDLDKQGVSYSTVVRALSPRPVVIRTMDLGGDKLPRFAGMEDSLKLRLGRRGLAFSLAERTLFRVQLQAILRSARDGNVRIMFPMVLGVDDLKEARLLLDELEESEHPERRPLVGAMIETPSAVFQIDEILELVDFVSIGTNDLAQYVLAIDRASPESSGAQSFLNPAVLRATHQVVQAAEKQAVELSVCGEAAGDPTTALLLIGMGVRNLSMSPFLATRVRQMIQHVTLRKADLAAQEALVAATEKDVKRLVTAALKDMGYES